MADRWRAAGDYALIVLLGIALAALACAAILDFVDWWGAA